MKKARSFEVAETVIVESYEGKCFATVKAVTVEWLYVDHLGVVLVFDRKSRTTPGGRYKLKKVLA